MTRVFKWTELLDFVESSIKKHCSIGSTIRVYHHTEGYLGECFKKKTPDAIFVPLGISEMGYGCKLPDDWRTNPSQDEVDAV